MTDRKAYMRDYMRAKRARARAKATDSVQAVNSAELTPERCRAIVREELERVLGPVMELLTKLTVNSVATGLAPAALAIPETPAESKTESPQNDARPFPYWKPDPHAPRDPRCQAMNRDGSRCRGKGEVLVTTQDRHGRLGEFGSCRRHAAEFRPHPVLTRGGKA